MDKNEKLKLQLAVDEADTWAKQYAKATAARTTLRNNAAQGLKALRSGIVPVEIAVDATKASETFNVLPLSADALTAITKLGRFVSVKPIAPEDAELLGQLESEVPRAVAEANRALASRRPTADDLEAGDFVLDYASWGLGAGIKDALNRITPTETAPLLNPANALAPEYGLTGALTPFGNPELVPADEILSRLATYTAAEKHSDLAKAIRANYPAYPFVVVCSPTGRTAADLLNGIELGDN